MEYKLFLALFKLWAEVTMVNHVHRKGEDAIRDVWI